MSAWVLPLVVQVCIRVGRFEQTAGRGFILLVTATSHDHAGFEHVLGVKIVEVGIDSTDHQRAHGILRW